MKTKKSIMMLLFMVMIVLCGITVQKDQVKAAGITGGLMNVKQAPDAGAGEWVINAYGRRYMQYSTGDYISYRWRKVGKYIYFFKRNGYAKKGMLTYNGKKYLFGSKGRLKFGWQEYKGNTYYFWKSTGTVPEAGSAATGKVVISGETYYFTKEGIMLTGWQKIGSCYYYFYPQSGAMARSTKIGKYQVDAKGRRVNSQTPVEPIDPTTSTGKVDIWVGDSRTVGLGIAKGISSRCIAEVGEGYSWFMSSGQYTLASKLSSNPKATVVFNLGVNDIDNYQNYINQYKTLKARYPKARFFFMSVNPIDFKKYSSPWVTDKKIKAFNTNMKAAFPAQYIDTYTYLKPYITYGGANYKSSNTDGAGLHYSTAIYKKIYNFVLTKV